MHVKGRGSHATTSTSAAVDRELYDGQPVSHAPLAKVGPSPYEGVNRPPRVAAFPRELGLTSKD